MLKNNPYIVIDFETGGFDCTKHAATEIAIQILSGNTLQELGRYEAYIKPYGYEYTRDALEFTGITLEKLDKEGKDLSVVMKELCDKINECREKDGTKSSHGKKPIMVGQNIQFDKGFCQQIFHESKIDIQKYFSGSIDFHGHFQPETLDSIHLAKLAFGNDETFASYKLGLICNKLGIEIVDAHKAMNDVEATTNVMSSLTTRLRSQEGVSSLQDKIRIRNHHHFQY